MSLIINEEPNKENNNKSKNFNSNIITFSTSHPFLSLHKDQISLAANLLEKSLIIDEIVSDPFNNNLSEQINPVVVPIFKKTSSFPLPATIKNCLKDKSDANLIGISHVLNCAWFVNDNNLILWNYEEQRFQVIKETDNIIKAIEIIEAPKLSNSNDGNIIVFMSTNEHVLVLIGETTMTQLFTIHKKITIPTNNEKIISFNSSKQGKVFMCSENGDLFELEYNVFK